MRLHKTAPYLDWCTLPSSPACHSYHKIALFFSFPTISRREITPSSCLRAPLPPLSPLGSSLCGQSPLLYALLAGFLLRWFPRGITTKKICNSLSPSPAFVWTNIPPLYCSITTTTPAMSAPSPRMTWMLALDLSVRQLVSSPPTSPRPTLF